MTALYSLGILIYSFIIRCAALFNPKAKLWHEGRKNLNLDELVLLKGSILVQCSSLGEFEQAQPLLIALRNQYPKEKIVLSFFSPSGYESKKHIDFVDKVIYLPIDTPKKTRDFVSVLQPSKAFFIKYDFWPNLYKALNSIDCDIYLISTIFRPDQAFFKWYGKWYKKTLNYVKHFFVQNEESKQLLKSIGLTNVQVTGDTRFDQVLLIKEEPFQDDIINTFTAFGEHIAVGGSTWPIGEELLLKCIEKFPQWKWIIAPHEVHSNHISELTKLFQNINYTLYSKGKGHITADTQVLIIDTIGILKYLYRYGKIAYIGGGFGKGIHNTLEPAVYGIPVLFGPKHQKFQEAQDLLTTGIGHEVNKDNILSVFESIEDDKQRIKIHKLTEDYIEKQKGAISKIMNYLM